MKYLHIIILGSLLLFNACTNKETELKGDTEIESSVVEQNKIPETKYGIDIEPYNIIAEKVKKNQNIGDIFGEHNIGYDIVLEASNLDSIFDIKRIKTGQGISFFYRKNDSLQKPDYIVYEKDIKHFVVFDLRDRINIYIDKKDTEVRLREVSGKITSSLWNAMTDINVNPILAIELSEVYAWSIDFFGLQKGDNFSIIYQEEYIDSIFYKIDTIHAIRFDHSNHFYYAYRYKQDSMWSFFDEEGNSLRKEFLKAPLRFSRISSGYSHSRFHPVLKIRRPHHGIDYAARTGTPIHSIGDGRVVFIGRKGGYGRRVEIKHNSVYKSGYAHMSRYAKGLRNGDFVKQGQVIGYVGMSGTATGPHLDFRVYKNGSPINPLKMKSPPVTPIKEINKKEFLKVVEKYQGTLDSLILETLITDTIILK